MTSRSSLHARSGHAVSEEARMAPPPSEHPDHVDPDDQWRAAWYAEIPDLLPERVGELLALAPPNHPEHHNNDEVRARRDKIMAALDLAGTQPNVARQMLGDALIDPLLADLGTVLESIVGARRNR